MAASGLHYNKSTGEIAGSTNVSRDSDLVLNKKEGLELFKVSNSHRAIGRLHEYEILEGKIKRKSQVRIDKHESDKQEAMEQGRMPEFLKSDDELINEIMIEKINTLNAQAGITNISIEELKADLVERRELHRNPDKK